MWDVVGCADWPGCGAVEEPVGAAMLHRRQRDTQVHKDAAAMERCSNVHHSAGTAGIGIRAQVCRREAEQKGLGRQKRGRRRRKTRRYMPRYALPQLAAMGAVVSSGRILGRHDLHAER